MRTRSRALLLAALLPACSSSPAPVEFDSFASEALDAICDWAVRCQHVPDRPTCERTIDPKDYDSRRAADSIAAGLSTYDPVAAASCIETTRDGFCLATPFADPSCARVFVGVRSQGEACTSARECAGAAFCEIASCPGQCCEGVCGPPREPPPIGGTVAVGGACEGHGDCVVDAYCETDRRCASFGDREGDRCLIGCARGDLYCDIEVFVCRRFGGSGERCDPEGETAAPCDPAWAVCDGVCRPRPGLGERCDDGERRCIPTTLCDLSIERCVPRRGLGEPCADRGECERECDRGTGLCAPYSKCQGC